jgi:hypothetical protein
MTREKMLEEKLRIAVEALHRYAFLGNDTVGIAREALELIQAPEVETRNDTKRLDWMIRREVQVFKYYDGYDTNNSDPKKPPFKTPREAIDAAMDSEVQGEVKNG